MKENTEGGSSALQTAHPDFGGLACPRDSLSGKWEGSVSSRRREGEGEGERGREGERDSPRNLEARTDRVPRGERSRGMNPSNFQNDKQGRLDDRLTATSYLHAVTARRSGGDDV